MSFWNKFYNSVAIHETNTDRLAKSSLPSKGINIDKLSKLLLTWIVGGTVSLFPTFMQLLISEGKKNLITEFFSNKDLFLVITTLTITAMFETIFDNRGRVAKYIIVSMGIILVVISVYIFTLIQLKIDYNYFYIIGLILFLLCISISMWGYIFVSKEGVKKSDE